MTNSRDLVYLAADIAAAKMKQRMLSVFIASLLAGLFIGLGYLGYLHVARETNKYFASLVFGTGLVLIVIGGGELFTGNCLMTLGVFFRRFSYWRMTLYLLMVWIGNFIGATSLVVLLELGARIRPLGRWPCWFRRQKSDSVFPKPSSLAFSATFWWRWVFT